MKRRLRVLFVLLFVAVFIRPGNSCSFSPDEDVFTQRSDPDAPYSKYVEGRLGILQGSYRIRHLVVAYNTLSGRGLTPSEQHAAVAVDDFYNSFAAGTAGSQTPAESAANPPSGQEWSRGSGSVERLVPGQNWQTFPNCLSDAFANADATLADRRARNGKAGAPDTPEIEDWIAAQRAVFSNCSGPGQPPKPAPATAPQWLRQDRAYQLAAAQFYSLDYDRALASFRAIAADSVSPWSSLASYLVARVLIRRAVVPYRIDAAAPDQMDVNNAKVRDGLGEARAQLESILRDPGMKTLHRQSRQLLDYVMARLDPQAQADELARRLTAPKRNGTDSGDSDYAQNVIDLSYIYNTLPLYTAKRPSTEAASREPLIRWIANVSQGAQRSGFGLESVDPDNRDQSERSADAIMAWHSTNAQQWLVAALTTAAPGAPGNAQLTAAARAILPASSAFASVTYHRLRLAAGNASIAGEFPSSTRPVYAEVSALMPRITQSQPLSTINLFADVESSLSPTLDDFLANATRQAASLTDSLSLGVLAVPASAPSVTLCGVAIYAPETRHLDDQTALIFNQRMPLRMLKEAVLASALPGNTRFQVAHMAWTRALLLDDPETARALSSYLAGCQPAFAPWLKQYDAARTPDERHVLGLLALMRFTSTEPRVRVGLERDFADYDGFRDNWWATVAPPLPGVGSPEESLPHLFSDRITARTQQADPPFIIAADRAQADEEIARLQKIPCASDYFARQTLSWVRDHPSDPRDADLVGFAMRVVRNGCRTYATKDLNHQLFDLLHRRFSKSEWAARYTTWE
jgi:hypothetical protein